ncbi:hypothetical protein CR513_08800, partial [Mucuna pruriens]
MAGFCYLCCGFVSLFWVELISIIGRPTVSVCSAALFIDTIDTRAGPSSMPSFTTIPYKRQILETKDCHLSRSNSEYMRYNFSYR